MADTRGSEEQKLPGNMASVAQADLVFSASMFLGPLPPPEVLARYNEIVPNGAERIMAMAERQSSHRERVEAAVINGNLSAQRRGSWFAFILAITSVLIGGFLIYSGKNIAGFATIVSYLVALAGAFLYSQRGQKRELDDKAEALKELQKRA